MFRREARNKTAGTILLTNTNTARRPQQQNVADPNQHPANLANPNLPSTSGVTTLMPQANNPPIRPPPSSGKRRKRAKKTNNNNVETDNPSAANALIPADPAHSSAAPGNPHRPGQDLNRKVITKPNNPTSTDASGHQHPLDLTIELLLNILQAIRAGQDPVPVILRGLATLHMQNG